MSGETYRAFFEAFFGNLPESNSNGDIRIGNPFRDDPNPSLCINLEEGTFNDFGSDFRGDAIGLYTELFQVGFKAGRIAVEAYLEGKPWVAPIPEHLVDQWHSNLESDLGLRAYLTSQRGIALRILREYKIGWDGSRYTIPVRSAYGIVVNIRRYDPKGEKIGKMISYHRTLLSGESFTGWGSNRLYPMSSITSADEIVLQEGEWDCLVQLSKGISAITPTGGAGSWSSDWTPLFEGKDVYICYDVDAAGMRGAISAAEKLHPVARSVKIIALPLSGKKGDNDLSDYYRAGYDVEDFRKLVEDAEVFKPRPKTADKKEEQTSLAEARQSRFKGKRISFDVQVIGKDTAPYNVPASGKLVCPVVGSNDRLCPGCGLAAAAGEMGVNFPASPAILELIKASKQAQTQQLRAIGNIPTSCRNWEFDEEASTNVEEVLIAPEVPEYSDSLGGSEYLVQTAYFVNEPIDSNRSYKMSGVMTPDPWQQHVTFLLDKATPLQDKVETFTMSSAMKERLSVFQARPGRLKEKYAEIHDDLASNVTHIVGRSDLLTGIDLVYHSVLGFNFQKIPVSKGWVEFLCIGDTRTGKTETTEAILRHYKLGEMSVAENTSYAGLVGGLQQTGDKRWFLTWGKLPLNDGRVFVIDEASGLSHDDIAKMSGIRSSGIAEITKIQTERTAARTRLIWLSNPRSGNSMGSYSHGVQAVAELAGKAEDISRFDFVVSAAKDEIPISLINKVLDEKQQVPHKYTSSLCKDMVLWAWSRKPEDVIITDEATRLILKVATYMGRRYSSQIPLVEGASQRIKLARLAVAAACRVFSTDESGEKVIVTREHVEFVKDYLTEIYSKPSLNYAGYSASGFLDSQAAEKNREAVTSYLQANPDFAEICVRTDYIWARTLEEQLDVTREEASQIISQFSRWRMLQDANSRGYRKTAGFIGILRQWQNAQVEAAIREYEDEEDFD